MGTVGAPPLPPPAEKSWAKSYCMTQPAYAISAGHVLNVSRHFRRDICTEKTRKQSDERQLASHCFVLVPKAHARMQAMRQWTEREE